MFNSQSGVKLMAVALAAVLWLLAAGGCGSSRVVTKGPGGDENLARLNRAARIAYDNGQLEQAANLYHQALDRAYLSDDRQAIVDANYNLAVCLLGLRSYDRALARVHEAQRELARADRSISGDILLLEATTLFRAAEPDEAWRITDRILSASERPPAAVVNKAHYLRGLISDQRGDTAQLGREFKALEKSAGPDVTADREELAGRLAMAEGHWVAAIEAFDRTAGLRREALDYAEMAQALALAADACHRAGKTAAAATRYFRAGRSAVQQGHHPDAIKWLSSANQMAGEAGDEPLKQEVQSYLNSIPPP
jgi:tetratricopeptide (TPR) repeat protein